MAVVKVPMVEVEVILLIMAQVVTIIIKIIISINHHFHIFLLTKLTSFQDLGQAGIIKIKAMDQVVILSFSLALPALNPNLSQGA